VGGSILYGLSWWLLAEGDWGAAAPSAASVGSKRSWAASTWSQEWVWDGAVGWH